MDAPHTMSLWNWITGYDPGLVEQASAANARLQDMNREDYGPGGRYYSPANFAAVQANYQAQDAALGVERSGQLAAFGTPTLGDLLTSGAITDPFDPARLGSQITDDFWKTATAAPRAAWRVTGRAIAESLKTIPWWIWLGAGVALFLYLGGGPWLRKKLSLA